MYLVLPLLRTGFPKLPGSLFKVLLNLKALNNSPLTLRRKLLAVSKTGITTSPLRLTNSLLTGRDLRPCPS